MLSSRERKQFIDNIQEAVINNEDRRFNDTSSFLNSLNAEIDRNLRMIRQQYREFRDIKELRSDLGMDRDLGIEYRMRWNRELSEKVRDMRDSITDTIVSGSMEHFINTYTSTYQSNVDSFGFGAFFTLPDKRAIVTAINYPWSDIMWSDRVWNNTHRLTTQLQQSITGGLLRGDSFRNIAKEIDRSLIQTGQKIKYVTERIVRTETARVRYVADTKFYKDIKLEELEFCAIIDNKTSKVCRDNDGKIFAFGKEPPIPLHPHCRSTYLPVVPNRTQEEWLQKINEAKALDNPQPVPTKGDKKPTTKKTTTKKSTTKKTTAKKDTTKKPKKENDRGTKIAKNTGLVDKKGLEKKRKELQDIIDIGQISPTYRSYIPMANTEISKIDKLLAKAKDGDYYADIGTSYYKLQDGSRLMISDWKKYTSMGNGDYFLNVKSKISKTQKDEIVGFLDSVIKDRPDLHGIKISIDNGVIKNKGRAYTLGGYSPSSDNIRMGTMAKYEEVYKILGYSNPNGSDIFYDTLVHELGHRNHNFYSSDKMEGAVLDTKVWEKWEQKIEPFYERYRKDKEVNFGVEWDRFNYPVNAEDSYKDRLKSHFYKEMWAESHAVIYNTNAPNRAEELAKLNKYFPGIEEFMRDVLS